MKVRELMAALSAMPQDLPVVYYDNEWGHFDVERVDHLSAEQANTEHYASTNECVRLGAVQKTPPTPEDVAQDKEWRRRAEEARAKR